LTVREYLTSEGVSLYRRWLATLDLSIRARVEARVFRFESGNLGDHKSVGGGVWEARLNFGAGYRLYFGRPGRNTIVLIVGGEKQSQVADIERAKRVWADFSRAMKHGKTN
jgi:putative addiction module killer protein